MLVASTVCIFLAFVAAVSGQCCPCLAGPMGYVGAASSLNAVGSGAGIGFPANARPGYGYSGGLFDASSQFDNLLAEGALANARTNVLPSPYAPYNWGRNYLPHQSYPSYAGVGQHVWGSGIMGPIAGGVPKGLQMSETSNENSNTNVNVNGPSFRRTLSRPGKDMSANINTNKNVNSNTNTNLL